MFIKLEKGRKNAKIRKIVKTRHKTKFLNIFIKTNAGQSSILRSEQLYFKKMGATEFPYRLGDWLDYLQRHLQNGLGVQNIAPNT